MATTVSIHSFRGGTGKSNTTANLATAIAASGRRVAVIDTDIQSPGIHVLFGIDSTQLNHTLNDYLWGNCAIADAALDVSPDPVKQANGRVFLIPSSTEVQDIYYPCPQGRLRRALVTQWLPRSSQDAGTRLCVCRYPSRIE